MLLNTCLIICLCLPHLPHLTGSSHVASLQAHFYSNPSALSFPSVSSHCLPLAFSGLSFLTPFCLHAIPNHFLPAACLSATQLILCDSTAGNCPVSHLFSQLFWVRYKYARIHVTLAQALAVVIFKYVYECCYLSLSTVMWKCFQRLICWVNYTPCLLSVFSSALASSCLFHSCSLNSHMPAIFSPTCMPSYLFLELLFPLSSGMSQMSLRSFPKHFDLTSFSLTLFLLLECSILNCCKSLAMLLNLYFLQN